MAAAGLADHLHDIEPQIVSNALQLASTHNAPFCAATIESVEGVSFEFCVSPIALIVQRMSPFAPMAQSYNQQF